MRTNNCAAVIMGGGRGTRLFPLTRERCKPAVPIGGRYRLIDVPISNCINSGINQIYVLTQFNTASLHRHIQRTYQFDIFSGGFCSIRAAEQTLEREDWYQGTADAVRQNLRYAMATDPSLILILSGDQLYRMDYDALIQYHREKDADVTLAVHPVDRVTAMSMGLMHVDDNMQVIEFVEKPKEADKLDKMKLDPAVLKRFKGQFDPQKLYMANMGIYLFKREVLIEMLKDLTQVDFGREVMPANIERFKMFAYPFSGYWEDIGTIKAFYDANMALTERPPLFNFFDPNAPIYTRPRFLPPTKFEHCHIDHSLVCEGCFLERCEIKRCLLSDRSVVREGAVLRDVFMMGSDLMEDREMRQENRKKKRPDIGVGAGTVIERAIIDKGARIGSGVRIRDHRDSPDADGEYFFIRDGITIIPRQAVVPDGVMI